MKTTTPAITLRASADRGHANHGWLDTHHSFSFSSYYDGAHMGFRSLRVINQDRIAAGAGFPTHPHRDMEIFSYVLEGALSHKDSMGNARELRPGQSQLMSAGSGVTHSEFNPSGVEPLHILQIWIEADERGLTPSYTEWHPTPEIEARSKVLVISPDGRENSARIHQDAFVYRLRLEPGERVTHELAANRGLWLQATTGEVRLNETSLQPGDGASAEEPRTYDIAAGDQPAEALLFDLA